MTTYNYLFLFSKQKIPKNRYQLFYRLAKSFFSIFTVESNHISLTATKTGTLITNGKPRVNITTSATFTGIVNIKFNNGNGSTYPLLNDTISFDSNGELITKTYSSSSPMFSTSQAPFTRIVVTLTIPDIAYLQTNNIIINELAYRTVTTSESGGLTQIGKYNNAKIKGLYYNASQNIPMPANWDNYSLSSSYFISYGKSADIYVVMDNESLTGQVEVSNKWDIIKADTIEETNINRDFPFYNSKWENGCCVSVPEIRETGDFTNYSNSQITYTRNGSANSLTANMFIEDTETTPTVIYVPGNHVKRILYNQCTDGYVYAIPDYGYSITTGSPSSAGIAGAQRTNSPIKSATKTIGSTTIQRIEATDSGVKAPEVTSIYTQVNTTSDGRYYEEAIITFKNPNSSGYYLRYKNADLTEVGYKTSYVQSQATTTVSVSGDGIPVNPPPSVVNSVLAFFVNTDRLDYYKHSSLVKVTINGGKEFKSISDRDIFIEETDIKKIVEYPFKITTFQPELSFSGGYMYLSNYADIPESARSHIYPVLVRHVHHKVGSSVKKIRHLWKYDNSVDALHLGLTIDWSDGKILTSNQVLESLLNGRKSYYSSLGTTTKHYHQYIGLSLNYYVDPSNNTHSPESSTYIDLDNSTMTKTLVDHCVYKTA